MSLREWWRRRQEVRLNRQALKLMRELGREFGRKRPIEVAEQPKPTPEPVAARRAHERGVPGDFAYDMDCVMGADSDGW